MSTDSITVELTHGEISTISLVLSREAEWARVKAREALAVGDKGRAKIHRDSSQSFASTVRILENARLATLEGEPGQ